MGAAVTGIDPSPENIAAAGHHAAEGGLAIDYRATTAEALAETGGHLRRGAGPRGRRARHRRPAVHRSLRDTGRGRAGCSIASTINRTLKAFALAIVGAEYVLRWLPRGTHTYDKLVTPAELGAAFRAAGLTRRDETGVIYVPIADRWRLSPDIDVNYMMVAGKPGLAPGSYQGNS